MGPAYRHWARLGKGIGRTKKAAFFAISPYTKENKTEN